MDFFEKTNIIKEEITIETDENDNTQSVIDLQVKVEVKSEEPEQLDWCIENFEIPERKCFEDHQTLTNEKCWICHTNFIDSYSLLCHNLTHLIVPLTEQRLYQCHHCLVCFTEKIKLTAHIKLKHFKILGFKSSETHECVICLKTFQYRHWREHMLNCHTVEKKFKCQHCNDRFKCKQYLRKHILYRHMGVKKRWNNNKNLTFLCDMCPKIFNSQACLRQHTKNCHSKSVECHICKSKLGSQSYLNSHMRRVHYDDGLIHKCEICFKQLPSRRNLNRHFKYAHAKVELKNCFYCNLCHRKLQSEFTLKKHMKKCPVVNQEIKVD